MADRADPAAATEPLRIGILGAARIAPLSIVEPAAATGHRLVAVAARDASRARAFAADHGIERVQESYAAVIADPEVEVVYNPLPNSMHAKWNVRAAEAGKHVLSEKPAAMNVEDARRVRDAVAAAGVVFMEAFHYPYHPLFRRVCQLLAGGAVGEVQHVEAILKMPAPPDSDPLLVRRSAGEIFVPMFPVPHEGDSLVLRQSGRDEVVEHLGTRSSYTFQLEAFADAVRRGLPVVTDAYWSVGNARLLEDTVAASR